MSVPEYMSFASWLGQSGGLVLTQTELRAEIEWARIQDNATDVQFIRFGRILDPQTVRIELDDTVIELNASDMGMGTQRKGIIFGIRGHPTLPALDIAETDVFVMDGIEYTVTFVNRHITGHVQASFEAVT